MERLTGEWRLYKVAAWLFLAGMLLFLGKVPLYLEEPRRALVAMEMLASGNYWASTLFGEWYYNKPPLFNWVLLLFAWLGGGFREWALRLPTVLSVAGLAGLLFLSGKTYVSARFGMVSSLLFVSFSAVLFYFSALAEIDLFYALIVFGGLLAIYHFGERKQYGLLFFLVYLSCALGVLAKGLPSLAFTALSLLAYFIDKKRFKTLFSPAHIGGILLLSGLLGAYAWKYAQYNNPLFLLETLVGESSDRTVASNSARDFFRQLVVFPLDVFKDLLPGGLLAIFLFRRDARDFLFQRHPFIRFCMLMLLVNIALYWLSPGTRIRYVYPLFPFAACVLAWGYERRGETAVWASRFFRTSAGVVTSLFALGALTLPFMPDLRFIPYIWPASAGFALVFAGLGFVWRRRPDWSLPLLLISLGVARLLFDLTVLPQRAHDTEAQRNKALATQIHQLAGDRPLYLYGEKKVLSFTSSFYLNRLRRQPIRLQDQLQRGQYYLMPLDLTGKRDSVLLRFEYERRGKGLVIRR